MVFASFDVYSYTRGGRDFSKNNIVECTKALPPATLSLSFSGLQELLNGISWTTSTPQLKIPEPVLISGEASSPGASQTLSHLSLETPCEVGCGPRTESQKGKETWRWKVTGGASLLKPSRAAQVRDFQTVKSIHQASMTWLQKPGESLQNKHKARVLACRKRPGLKATRPPQSYFFGGYDDLFASLTNWRFSTPWSFLQIASSCSSPNLICYHDFMAHP